MRLICPNCDAQYEVDDAVIPAVGRDVQCSNCGQTWFQPKSVSVADAEGVATPPPPQEPPSASPTEDTAPPQAVDAPVVAAPEPEPAPAPAPEPELAPTPAPQDEYEEDAELPPTTPQPQRQELDSAIVDVLREEAQREAQARSAEAPADALESQQDLGLTEPEPKEGGGLKERIARLRGVAPDAYEEKGADGPRRDLLPDIEEINSTLRATSDRSTGAAAGAAVGEVAEATGRSGFGRGFGLIILLAVLLIGLYSAAPGISRTVPAAAPALAVYVEVADRVRVSMHGLVSGGAEKLTNMLNGLSGEGE